MLILIFKLGTYNRSSYFTRNILPTTRRVKLIEKKKFAVVAINPEYKAFVLYVAVFNVDSDDEIHPSRRAQIAHLKTNEAPTKVPSKYTDFADVFSPKLAVELFKYKGINSHAIKLIDYQQPPYSSIYNLGLGEVKILKMYIENNLINDFSKSFKSLTKAPIFFDKKLDKSLQLFVDYKSLNNLTIQNRYPLLSFVKKSLN